MSDWGPPQPGPRRRKSDRRQRSAVVSVRFSQEELAELCRRAQKASKSMSTYMREAALAPPQPTFTPRITGGQSAVATVNASAFIRTV